MLACVSDTAGHALSSQLQWVFPLSQSSPHLLSPHVEMTGHSYAELRARGTHAWTLADTPGHRYPP